jgi:hypothetical protein
MSIEEGTTNPDNKKLLSRFIFAGFILACCVWLICFFVIITGRGKGEIGYTFAIVFFIAWPVLSILLRFLGIFFPKKKK